MYEQRVSYASPFTRPPPATMAIMVATLVVTVIAMTADGWTSLPLAKALMCVPVQLFRDLKLWTPLTYPFVANGGGGIDPLSLILYEVFLLWMFAASVERTWGTRRFLVFFYVVAVGTAVVSGLIALVLPVTGVAAISSVWAMGDAILLAWVLDNWEAPIRFMFFLPMKAKHMLVLSLGIPVGFFLMGQVALVMPIFVALGIAYLFGGRRISLRRAFLQFRAWLIGLQLRRKGRKFRVVGGGNGEETKRKTYLH